MNPVEITQELFKIEQNADVRVLFAAEAGSRAWGWASPDSDYDIRFVYVRRREEYLRLNPGRDVIEWKLDKNTDMNGWDLKKALLLLQASNPTLFEWIRSRIRYLTSTYWCNIEMKLGDFFNPRKAFFHYLGMAESTFTKYLTRETVVRKKYFQALRSILSAKWILENGDLPPTTFQYLVECMLERDLWPIVDDLLDKKINGRSLGEDRPNPELNEYIIKSLNGLKEKKPDFGKPIDLGEFNQMFLDGIEAFYEPRIPTRG